MKLIRPTKFIKENSEEPNFKEKSLVYFQLLSREFHIGLFIPIDFDGKPITEPKLKEDDEYDYLDAVIQQRFNTAQSKVIFKGFEYVNEHEVRNKNLTINFNTNQFMLECYNGLGGGDIMGNTLEHLAMTDLELEMI